MGRSKKRRSSVEKNDKSNAKDELNSGGDHEIQPSIGAVKSTPVEHEHADPDVEEYGDERSANSFSEQDNSDEYVDVLGNGLLLKKVLDKGMGADTRPGHGDIVMINFKGWLDDGTLVEDVSSQTITLGDGDVVQALELALPLAELQERFELISDARFAYGSRGREPDIPGDRKIRYEVKLLSARDPPCYSSMSNADRVSMADEKRERGNYYYRREEYAFAVNSYNKALKILTAPFDELPSFQPSNEKDLPSSEDVDALEIKLQNNLAATQLKIQAYDAAIKSCDAVLRKDPTNFKALFRKGKALLEQGDADEALPILRSLHDMVPTSAVVASELQRARVLQQRERERWSRTASRMFPHLHRNKTRQSKLQRLRSYLFSLRLLFVVSIVVAICSIACAWYQDRLPTVESVKQPILSLLY